jgi:hypothetical protein
MRARALFGVILLTIAHASRADAADGEKASWENAPATRRGGVTIGALGGMSFGSVEGYPNDLSKLDNPAYRSATSGIGSRGMLYLGGALTDWFTFAFGLSRSSFGSSRLVSGSAAFLFHVEAFPLWGRGGALRDLGLFGDFGTGTATIKRRSDGVEHSSSGSLSIVGFGAFWEPWRLAGHLALGPYSALHFEDSNSMLRYYGDIGLRGAFYGGP